MSEFCNSAKSSFETWIFSGTFLALFDGKIGAPLLEISPLYKLSKSSPISSSSSLKSSTCSICFLNLYTALSVNSFTLTFSTAISLKAITVFLSLSLSTDGSIPEFNWVALSFAKERATQLNSGIEPSVDRDNDKNTVIALREIAVENVKVNELTDSAVYKLRKHIEQVDDLSEDDDDIGDDFESLYKGEISKSGAPILPSKRARKVPEKIQVSKEDLAELQNSDTPAQSENVSSEPQENETGEVSLDEIAENNSQTEENSETSEQ